MKRLSQLAALLTVIVMAMTVSGCGSSAAANSIPTIRIGRTEVFSGFHMDQAVLNEDYAISQSVIEPLIRTANKGRSLEPGIAESWEYNDDDTKLTIHLNPDAAFSDGKPVTAKDVAFSVEVWKKGPNYGASYQGIASTTVKDAHTIVFNLSSPDSSLPAFLSYSVAGVVPENFGGKSEAEFWQNPIGAGPYRVESWSTDGDIVLRANKHFYKKGYPKTERIINTYVADPNSLSLRLRSNQVDIVNQLDSVTGSSLDQRMIVNVPDHVTPLLSFNVKNSFLKQKKVRQALSWALDYDALVKIGNMGYGEVPHSSLPPNLDGSTTASNGYYHRDVKKAKALLKGVDIPDHLTLIYPAGQVQAMVQIVQANLKDVGVNVELQAVDGGTWMASLADGSFDLGFFNTNSQSPDLSDPARYVVSTNMMFSQMDPTELSDMIERYKGTIDANERHELVQQMDDYLTDEMPYVVMVDSMVLTAKQLDIKGVDVMPWSTYYYDTISR